MLSSLSTQYELWNYITFMTVYMYLLLSNGQESLIQTRTLWGFLLSIYWFAQNLRIIRLSCRYYGIDDCRIYANTIFYNVNENKRPCDFYQNHQSSKKIAERKEMIITKQ